MHRSAVFVAVCAIAVLPAVALGQRATRRGTAVEIRGQVPTPQVVTVRPRETPVYSRQVLVPAFFDHSFWPALLPGYDLVPRRMIIGATPGDSLNTGAPPAASPSSMTAPRDATARPATDTTRTPGTAPARTPR